MIYAYCSLHLSKCQSKDNCEKEVNVEIKDVCSEVLNNEEITLCVKFSDICVTKLDCEETELPGPHQVSPIKPIGGGGKRIILYKDVL